MRLIHQERAPTRPQARGFPVTQGSWVREIQKKSNRREKKWDHESRNPTPIRRRKTWPRGAALNPRRVRAVDGARDDGVLGDVEKLRLLFELRMQSRRLGDVAGNPRRSDDPARAPRTGETVRDTSMTLPSLVRRLVL